MERRRRLSTGVVVTLCAAIATIATGSTASGSGSVCPSDVLAAGQSIVANTSCSQLTSPGGRFTLDLYDDSIDIDQNVHATDEPPQDLFYATGPTWEQSTYHEISSHRLTLTLRRNGNLVLVTPKGRVLWSTKTAGEGATHAILQDNGRLVLRTSSGTRVWASNSGIFALGGGDRLNSGQRLIQTSYDWSCSSGGCRQPSTPWNTVTVSAMKKNGNFVAFCPNSRRVLWQTNTHVPGSYLAMLESGALVVKSPTGRVLWSSHTRGARDAISTLGTKVYAGTRVVWYAPEMGC